MRILILVGMIILTTLLCLAMSFRPGEVDGNAAKFAICFGPVLGIFSGLLLLSFIGSKPRRRRPRSTPRPRPVPRSQPFTTRLARFTEQEESELLTDSSFHSTMPFWIATNSFTRTRPKPASLIRRVLETIKNLVRK
ncbi:MAG: hypothetical protein AAGI63_10990 [Planctomycetota bacterium]